MSKSRGELFRDPAKGKIAGVCAGLANYFGWETWLVRILVVSGVLLGMGWFVILYIAGWFILDKKPSKFSPSQVAKNVKDKIHEEEVFSESIKVKAKIWQSGEPPKQAIRDISLKFKSLEHELRTMERYVTSPEFTVSREINKL
ncbi:envelope stress response membrane protein PspC [Thalassomonas sp. M1454]|uniref:envelope stress response membrane protein PspC n=1 Tax=Thalassomonas sp. M1454 TaxID=2594477 RepID=UPI00117DEF85|nr:envelope stress response membrane protein PspC [Thalassomonas sp. M1454]TRX57246.1 envelope stress response membrane protein PspC [Thalassomonas sp. M1454]